ncbi:peptidase C14, caspase domain-containing protein [Gymnopilus junonius]|uniref:Peptidase C14, caspase domain-containing protein n=1 Tax=Gymnopilus junonius TaxID=109634 RepID=A0A9P5N9K8_GYMJU|nr:peptidase C14, caspase domain-containing protein [Gymnopilus junonius]
MSPTRDRGFLDDVLKKYFELLPPNRDFVWSKCTGRKKAVCIGINYTGSDNELKGCANDAKNMRQFLMEVYGFRSEDILLLTDDGHGRNSVQPTRKEMFNAMKWLVQGAHAHDSLFFHYSGHGGQTPDKTGRETDGKDEVIFPVDFKQTDDIIDDELHDTLVRPLPAGCRLTSCHSGTHSAHGRLRGITHISRRARERGASASDVICFAACKDDETSADTFHGGVATGAMSYEFIHSLRRTPHQTYEQLLEDLRDRLIPKYHQKAQISGTHPVDLDRDFIL